jgi:hypothetical protein
MIFSAKRESIPRPWLCCDTGLLSESFSRSVAPHPRFGTLLRARRTRRLMLSQSRPYVHSIISGTACEIGEDPIRRVPIAAGVNALAKAGVQTAPSRNQNGVSYNPVITLSLNVLKIGAGDGIRTHDPNLGKVVLYP